MSGPLALRAGLGVGLFAALLLGGSALGLALWPTRPQPLAAKDLPAHQADLENGRQLFLAGGCLSCHGPDRQANPSLDPALPSGGQALATPIGTFYPPNLTPDLATGIGAWSPADFASALLRGVSRNAGHLYPVFPYTSYQHMILTDVLDLRAYLMSLAPVEQASRPETVLLSAVLRPFIGFWKALALDGKSFQPDPTRPADWNRGAYLVAGPGHCGECHTPRNLLMLPKTGRFLQGGPHPSEKGKVPSLIGVIGPKTDYKTAEDLYDAFKYGEMFGYDGMTSGGMGKVQANLAQLDDANLRAIVTYLSSLE